MVNFGKRMTALLLIDRPAAPRAAASPRQPMRPGVRDGLALARAARGLRTPVPGCVDSRDRFSNQASI